MNRLFNVFTLLFALLIFLHESRAQTFTRQDSLKGGLTEERIWWDLTFYDLNIDVDTDNEFISGSNVVHYKVLKENQVMQIDLQAPMEINKILQNGKELQYTSEGAAHFIQLNDKQKVGSTGQLEIFFSGNPVVAKNPPWDGGFTWSRDKNGNPFVATSNQGIGASVWWPCKEHPYDEVDSMLISVEVPNPWIDVSNGRLRNTIKKENTTIYQWFVTNPINNYGVNINIGDYVNFEETYDGEKGKLDCSYWVLSYNKKLAKKQFEDVPRMLEAFEHWFGPYPLL